MTEDRKKAHQRSSPARVLSASLIGSSIEFYDFYIYGIAASLVFGQLFFPSTDPAIQLLLSYATFSIAFVARPLGAFIFGHFGDRYGRKANFIASLLVMGVCTVAIGLLPTYETVGWFAPLMLSLLRFGQGLGLGGLWSGATLLATESAPATHRARFSMVPQFGFPLGFIAANGVFLILGYTLQRAAFEDWGWRVPFLASIVLIGLGLWSRLNLEEPAEFVAGVKKAPPRTPVVALIRDFPAQAFASSFATVNSSASYYLSAVFCLGYATTTLGYSRQDFLILLMTSIPWFIVGVAISGVMADRLPPRRILAVAALTMIGAGFLLNPLMVSGSTWSVWFYLSLTFFLNAFTIGPLGVWMSNLFPHHVRYTGTAVGYNLGNIIGAGFAPMIATALAQRGGLTYVGYYLSLAAFISFLAFAFARPRKD